MTGLKDVHQAKVGDTITLAGKQARDRAAARLPRAQADGVVRAVPGRGRRLLGAARGARPAEALRRGAASSSPRRRQALGFGFRCGFLGLLHMDIVKERLEREFDLELIATAPNVEFHVIRGDEMSGRAQPGRDAAPAATYDRVEEPMVLRHDHHAGGLPGRRDRDCARRAAASWST